MEKLLNVYSSASAARKARKATYNNVLWISTILLFVLVLASCQKETKNSDQQTNSSQINKSDANSEAKMRVFATGLNNPRGLKFGPDGNLYVAEGGTGGTTMTECTQVIAPVGPYLGSETGGRISKITPDGVRTTVTNSLPSSQTSEALGNLVSGVADVEFVGNTLYAILAGAGCSHGVANVPNGVVRVNNDGTWSMIANLSAWQQSHPVAHPEPDDFEPDGTWYSMINVRGDLYAVEPNHGEMVKVTTSGDISRVIDISASQGHIVPTVVAYHGNFYVSNLNTFPVTGGASSIYKITPDGSIKVVATGFNTVLGLVIDQQNRMYVLENTAGPTFPTMPTPGFGRVIRVDPSGNRTVIATGLNLPSGMTMGPDGKLYVSNWGFGPPPIGLGEIVQIDLTN